MPFIQKKNYKWFVMISIFLLMLLPSVMPSQRLGDACVLVTGAVALIFEFFSFNTAQTRSQTIQGVILFILTIALVVVSFIY